MSISLYSKFYDILVDLLMAWRNRCLFSKLSNYQVGQRLIASTIFTFFKLNLSPQEGRFWLKYAPLPKCSKVQNWSMIRHRWHHLFYLRWHNCLKPFVDNNTSPVIYWNSNILQKYNNNLSNEIHICKAITLLSATGNGNTLRWLINVHPTRLIVIKIFQTPGRY